MRGSTATLRISQNLGADAALLAFASYGSEITGHWQMWLSTLEGQYLNLFNCLKRCLLHSLKDFATPSLNACEKATVTCDGDDEASSDDEGATAAEVRQFCLRRHWETRYDML